MKEPGMLRKDKQGNIYSIPYFHITSFLFFIFLKFLIQFPLVVGIWYTLYRKGLYKNHARFLALSSFDGAKDKILLLLLKFTCFWVVLFHYILTLRHGKIFYIYVVSFKENTLQYVATRLPNRKDQTPHIGYHQKQEQKKTYTTMIRNIPKSVNCG